MSFIKKEIDADPNYWLFETLEEAFYAPENNVNLG